jgi:hypothetical protein
MTSNRVMFIIEYEDGRITELSIDRWTLSLGDYAARIIARERQEKGDLPPGEIRTVRRHPRMKRRLEPRVSVLKALIQPKVCPKRPPTCYARGHISGLGSIKRIVVCGGGTIGAAIAYFTSRRGAAADPHRTSRGRWRGLRQIGRLPGATPALDTAHDRLTQLLEVRTLF